jgi:CRP/FNR family transcriptional regulator, cyclic AMP receptor protein
MENRFLVDKETSHAILACMGDVALFHGFTSEEAQALAPYFELRKYNKGEIIFKEGDPGDLLYFLCSGQVELKKETKFKGKHIIVALISKGSFMGELSVIDGEPRMVSAIASADCRVLLFRQTDLDPVLTKYPIIGLKLLKGISRTLSLRLRQTVGRLSAVL